MGVLGGRLRGRVASLDVFGPIADVLLGIEDQVGGTGHVVLPLALAHVVVGAVGPILVVADVSVLLGAGHVMSWDDWVLLYDFLVNPSKQLTIFGGVGSSWAVGLIGSIVFQLHLVVLQLVAQGGQKRVLATAAASGEVIHVNGPHHDASESLLLQPFGLKIRKKR